MKKQFSEIELEIFDVEADIMMSMTRGGPNFGTEDIYDENNNWNDIG